MASLRLVHAVSSRVEGATGGEGEAERGRRGAWLASVVQVGWVEIAEYLHALPIESRRDHPLHMAHVLQIHKRRTVAT